MEEKMKKICEGTTTRNDVVHECIEQYRDMFIRASQQTDVLKSVSIPRPFSPLRALPWMLIRSESEALLVVITEKKGRNRRAVMDVSHRAFSGVLEHFPSHPVFVLVI
jgi:hypothetical protein